MADEAVSGESERAARKWRGQKVITIRHSVIEDLSQIMEIYGYARSFMAAHGNPNQWGRTNWPPEDLIRSDIVVGKSYVCVLENEIVGTFFYDCGTDIEPTYSEIYDGSWLDASPYGVIHRIAANGIAKGVAHTVIMWARERCPHLRIDTHGDNLVMQNMLAKEGFSYRGIIYVTEDNDPRLAYEIV